MTPSQTLHIELEALKADLIAKYKELGMEASGQFERELEVEVKESDNRLRGTIRGVDYTEQLSEGRRPGKFPPLDQIQDWVEAKGLAARAAKDISVSSLAFLIARKIAREGTRYFQEGGTELIREVVTPERLQSIIDKVAELNVEFFVGNILDELKGLRTAA